MLHCCFISLNNLTFGVKSQLSFTKLSFALSPQVINPKTEKHTVNILEQNSQCTQIKIN